MTRQVYFIKPIGMVGPVKIGCSQSPDRRRSTLETWSPWALEIVAEIEGGEKLERRFHAKFTAQHKSREWFDWTPELGETIIAIAAGTFDIETLPPARRLHHGHRTGPAKGTKWSEGRKAQAKVYRAVALAEKSSGLVRGYFNSTSVDDFIRDPFKFGITREEAERQRLECWAKPLRIVPPTPTQDEIAA